MRNGLWSILLLVCVAALTAGVSAAATDTTVSGWTWLRAPGTAAVFQTPGSTTGVTYYAWGPDVTMLSGSGSWVHVPVQVTQNTSQYAFVRLVYVHFQTGSRDVGISQIHVWDGGTFVKGFNGAWTGEGKSTVTLDLGKNYRIRNGLTIAMNVVAGVESMNHEFCPLSAGGKFYIPP